MENQIPKTGNRRPARRNNKKVTPTTEAGNPVMFVTIEEHTNIINEKTSQLISLENGLRACEKTIENLESTITGLRGANQKLKLSLSNESIVSSGYLTKLNKIPNWIKNLFNAA